MSMTLSFWPWSERCSAYSGRAKRYVHIEVGHATQNAFLRAQAPELGAVVVGAFRDSAVKRVLTLSRGEKGRYLMPVGTPR
jgi:nitroreductase